MKMATQNLSKLLMMRNSLLLTFSIQFLTVLKSFSRLDSNSLTFLQLVKAVKTLTGGATWSIIYFDLCMYNEFSFSFLNGTCGEIHEMSLEPTLVIT